MELIKFTYGGKLLQVYGAIVHKEAQEWSYIIWGMRN